MTPHDTTTPAITAATAVNTPHGMARLPAAAIAATAVVWPALAGLQWGPQRVRSGLWFWWLRKPPFEPPNVALPILWTAIDTGLAAGAYRLLRHPATPGRKRALGWWAVNVALIGAWSAVFFGRRNLPASTLLAAAMVGTSAAYVAQARKVDTTAAVSGVVTVAWLACATVLAAELWRRNR